MTTSRQEQFGPLVPASNFEVRRIHNKQLQVRSCAFLIEGFGVWDVEKNGWVSLGKPVISRQGDRVHLPYVLRRKKDAQEAVSQGLYAGYEVVPDGRLEPLGTYVPPLSSGGRSNLISLT